MLFHSHFPRLTSLVSLVALSVSLAACGSADNTANAPTGEGTDVQQTAASAGISGTVLVDGSSTVFPISEAMAEEFQKANPNVRVTVGVSGTGGGFKKFCAGETDISNASRPIKDTEIELCQQNGIEYIELPVAYDGLSVVVNPQNDFATCLTVDELKRMWEPEAQGQVTSWAQVRPDFPDQKLGLYGAGTDSGTYDYFMESIVGKAESRGDYTASEDDNVTVQGVSTDAAGLGFLGFAYYEENQDKLKLVAVDGGNGCLEPNSQTIADGTYVPLSRPEFFYVKKTSATRPEVKAFVEFQIGNANKYLVKETGYVPVPDDVTALTEARFAEGKVGSVYIDAPKGASLKQLMMSK